MLAVSATLALAPNSRYHALVSDVIESRVPPQRPPVDLLDARVSAAIVRQLIVGLAIHDLPLVRDLVPDLEQVDYARALVPIGYDVGFRAGGALIRLTAVMLPEGADTTWRLSVVTTHERIDVDFPPPFVHDGSARVRVRDEDGRVIQFPPSAVDGYQAEWLAFARLLRGERPMEYEQLEADARFAIELADLCAAAAREGFAP